MKTRNKIFDKLFWIIVIVIGILLSGITCLWSTSYDRKNAEAKLANTINFIKERYASTSQYNSTAVARSLIRSSVSVNELKDETDFSSSEVLKQYCDSLWLTGISVLDNDGNLLVEYSEDGTGFNEFKSKLEFSAIADSASYLDKTYINRLTLNDNSYVDIAAHGISDGSGILIAYRHTKTEFADKSTLSVQSLLNGFDVESNGTIFIVNDNKVIASNDETLIGKDLSDSNFVAGVRYNNSANTLVRTTSLTSSNEVFGMYSHGRDNYVYAYLPKSDVYATVVRNVAAIVFTYVIFVAFVEILRYRSNRNFLEQQALQEAEYKKELEAKNKELELSIEHEAIANRSKREFLFNMSHDIRTPMNAIIGFTSLAATHVDNKEQVLDYLKKISISSQHLLSLINDVLDMSRIESGKVKIEEKVVHLPDLIHDLRSIIQSNVSAKRLSLLIDTMDVYDEDIITDPLRLNQVLLNILSNAIKFTPSGGTISIQIIQKNTGIKDRADYEFRVKDTGIGMSEEFMDHIFEEFAREETSTVSRIQGTGLGMAIAKRIVDLMGGTIEVNSEQGVGSEFVVKIRFKVADNKVEHKTIEQLEGIRALVADDDTDCCLNVCKMLRTIGLRPDWTISGKEAVIRAKDAIEQNDAFNVYIIDWMIPDMNGVEVVRNIRKFIGEETPIIILTAYDYTDIEQEAKEAGVTAFCSKPLFMSELREVLEKPFVLREDVQEVKHENFNDKRVLLAEDNELNREIAYEILKELGLTVDVVEDGKQALDAIDIHDAFYYDLVLMDVQMPNMDGYEATKAIRSLADKDKANVTIYAMTANAFEEDKNNALEAGMNGHIAKPFDIKQLSTVLSNILK